MQDVRERHGALPSLAVARAAWEELWVADAHNSTAIEGNTLVLAQVRELLRALQDDSGHWRSTREDVDAYLASKHRRATGPSAAS